MADIAPRVVPVTARAPCAAGGPTSAALPVCLRPSAPPGSARRSGGGGLPGGVTEASVPTVPPPAVPPSSCPHLPPPPLLPCRRGCPLPGAGFVSGKAAAAACVRSRLDAAQLLLAAPPRPNSEKAHTEDVCFPSVDIHGSFLFSMPLLSSQDLWSQWWLACPWPAMSCMGQPRWGCHLSVVTGAWCGPSPPHATGHLSRSSVSLMRTRLPHQPGHCLGTRLCPNVASLETGTLSLSGARWCFRFPILFRDRSLLPITQRGFLPYPTTCLALRSISCLPASAFCLL